MRITNVTEKDISIVLDFYKKATELMRLKGQVEWPEFSHEFVNAEVVENKQWKLLIGGQVACIWAIAYKDELIWGKEHNEPSLYIHRIATNPDFRGRGLVNEVVSWAKNHCIEKSLKYIRLDTVGLNHGLIKHYQKNGFEFLGTKRLNDPSKLPAHYQKDVVCFFQLKI